MFSTTRAKQRRPSQQFPGLPISSIASDPPSPLSPRFRRSPSPFTTSSLPPASPTLRQLTSSPNRKRLFAACVLFCVFLAFYHFTPAATPSPRHATEPLLIDVGPKRFVSETTQNERFLSYNTHSGYHNQRIALENALTLAKLLDRTLLLPPARLGSAVPWIQYEKLRFRLEQSNKAGLDHCTHFSRTGILPRECIGYFDWTMVNWDLFVDVDHIQNTLHQPLIDRWNDTDAWLEDHLGLDLNQDVYTFPEKDLYAYRFYDSLGDDEALDKFKQRVELQDLKAIPHRLLQLGSLFGTSRLRTVEEDNWEVRSSFRQAMVFRNPTLDRITDHIRDRLGGDTAYYAVHMRVGDGVFRTEAKSNVVAVLRQLLEEKMGLHSTTVGDALRLFASDFLPSPHLNKRSSPSLFNNVTEGSPSLIKRARNSRPQRPGAYNHPWPPDPPLVTSRNNSPLHRSLQCRGKLHPPKSAFVKLNHPLFLATDSRIPTSDPLLAPFFKIFPCTFILGDFMNDLNELLDMRKWTTQHDQVDLSQFLWPVIDMMAAAKARNLVGTPGSTFSRFASDVLFQSYHGWDIM